MVVAESAPTPSLWEEMGRSAVPDPPASATTTFRFTNDNQSTVVYNILMVVIMVFLIRVIITASICQYIFNTTFPILVETFTGKNYDRKTFRPLPLPTVILLVVMIFILFPSRW